MDTIPNTTETSYNSSDKNDEEDIHPLKNNGGVRLFSGGEIRNYIQQHYKQLYSKHSLPTYEKQWSNYRENKTQICQENRLHKSDEYNQPIQLNEVKRALSLLRNNKSKDLHTTKNEFLKYGGEAITKGLFPRNTTVKRYTNSVELISYNQHR